MTLFLALILFLPAQAGDAADADTLVALGDRLYAERDMRGAAAAYEGALATGRTGPEFELRLGNTGFLEIQLVEEAGRIQLAPQCH